MTREPIAWALARGVAGTELDAAHLADPEAAAAERASTGWKSS